MTDREDRLWLSAQSLARAVYGVPKVEHPERVAHIDPLAQWLLMERVVAIAKAYAGR